ncbi:DoxX family protein [Thalassomonas sp. M1454]|uniref:HvfX family Cu-binding RiPP maturation protein n=1 Tax=Thalassomonas sp. M1454 TaxID=2594477 RepID=UPI00117C7739|nr:DoxX family protein [Thalassomonas sp. M1454]TRX56853.1 DoxX family protein [Thalassomonas sp. M1454]
MNIISLFNKTIAKLLKGDAIPAILLRLYLAPVFIIAGYNKMQFSNHDLNFIEQLFADPSIVAWFGNSEWGLGMPFPELLANLAAWTEFFGGWLLLVGLATRLISIPLMFTMIIAATSVHLDNGWYALTPTNSDTSSAKVFSWLGFESADASLENSDKAAVRISKIKDIIDENGSPDWLYETGNVVLLNNGIEFAATYFIMLMALFFIGAGRFVSIDYWLFKSDPQQASNRIEE